MMSVCTVLNHAKLIKQQHERFENLSGLLTGMVKDCSYLLPFVCTRGPFPSKGWPFSLDFHQRYQVEAGPLEADAEVAAC